MWVVLGASILAPTSFLEGICMTEQCQVIISKIFAIEHS